MSRRRSVVGSPFIGGTPVPGPLTATQFITSAAGSASSPAFIPFDANSGIYWEATKGVVGAVDGNDRLMMRVDRTTEVSSGTNNVVPAFKVTTSLGSTQWFVSQSTPEAAITSAVGGWCIDVTNSAVYFKASGSGNTGWVRHSRSESGTYTPTATATANLDSATGVLSHYIRVGDQVSVWGKINVDPTASGAIQFRITLPVASNLGAATDLSGNAVGNAAFAGQVQGDFTNDAAQFDLANTSTTAYSVFFSFAYTVI